MPKNVKVDVELFPDALAKVIEDGIGEILQSSPAPVECPECGTEFEVNAAAVTCPKCGLPVEVKVDEPEID
ncbi:MAG: hypothetical protein IJ113_07305 [Eggerthellaceae bacterium]|nr:hypothetical protein [Eggerthellaceae bacterium]